MISSSLNGAFLTTQEMEEVGGAFRGAWWHLLGQYEQEARDSITVATAHLIMKQLPFMWVTAEGVPQIVQAVWGNEGYRDFVLRLSFVFFARWGHSPEKVKGLAGNLARGVALVDPVSDVNAMPVEARERLADINAAEKIMAANTWLVVALMIPLFITLEELGKAPKK